MSELFPEQITLILSKDIAELLAVFLLNHMYEFRRLYDEQKGIKRDKCLHCVPTFESRMAWLELIKLLKGESDAI